jgi:methylaspartate ammonia-lyase
VIIRILGEGQWNIADEHLDELNQLDAQVESAVNAGNEAALTDALAGLLEKVRSAGTALADEEIATSDLVLPFSDASLDDVRDLLNDDGLIPG